MFSRIRDSLAQWKHLFRETSATTIGNAQKLDALSQQIEDMQRELRLIVSQATLPAPELWKDVKPGLPMAPAKFAFDRSTICRQESFGEPYFAYWTAQLQDVLRYHRKLWEFVFICQALHERGLLTYRKRGLGFGVGAERLTAYFASRGCHVVATDLAVEHAVDTGWMETSQHAAGKEQLRYPPICTDYLFDRNVSFRPCDMNAIDDDLVDFDFCWSACAFEHLGSIENGLRFVERSIDCLKPGGYAVHTTEFNLSSNDATLDNASTVLFREQDMRELARRLTAKGHRVAPFDFTRGVGEVDRYIDMPPYLADPHLTMALSGYVTTSVGLIVQRGA